MERIIQADIIPEDDKIEQGLRPSHLSEYIGQEKAKKNLRVFIEAAKNVASRSIMCCCMALRDSVKRHWHRL